MIDGQQPTVGPAHREAGPEDAAQQVQQAQQAQQPASQSLPPRQQQGPPPPLQRLGQEPQAPSPAGPYERLVQRRGSFSGPLASGAGWDVHLQRAGSSPALSGLGAGPSAPAGSLGTLSSAAGEPSTDTLFARPLA